MTTPLAKKSSSDGICEICRVTEATCFCLCGSSIRRYCVSCDSAHYQQTAYLTHSRHPISVYQSVVSGKTPIDVFRKKQLFINEFQRKISEELMNFDAFVGEISQGFESLVCEINAKKEKILRDLQIERGKLVAAMSAAQEVIDSKRYVDASEAVTSLDDYICNGYATGAVYDVKMFRGVLKLSEIRTLVEKSVSYEVFPKVLEGVGQDIPVINGGNLRLFNRRTLQRTELTLRPTPKIDNTLKIDKWTAYCYISTEKLMCSGGSGRGDVYEVNVRTGEVNQLQSMSRVRALGGIWNYKYEFVFVFGGWDGAAMISSEKYSLTDSKTWTDLPNPIHTVKHWNSVCEHSSGLYISGPTGAVSTDQGSSVEFFNPLNESFQLLRTDSLKCCFNDLLYWG